MAKKTFAAVIIENNKLYYKLHTVALSNDGSLHFVAGFNDYFRRSKLNNLIPSKGTYHKSGVKHFTHGSGAEKWEIFRKVDNEHAGIVDSQGLETITIKDVANSCVNSLDKFTKFNGYDHLIKFNSDSYTNLTVKYFLANKDFDTSKSSHLYTEVYEIDFMDRKLIVATNNSTNTDELMQVLL